MLTSNPLVARLTVAAQALSDFAEYVEQQQNLRFPALRRGRAASSSGPSDHHHEELDELFDNLDLGDTAPRIPLRDLLLGRDPESLERLGNVVSERIAEGMGETVFELGFENGGDSMHLTREQWDAAYQRLAGAAKSVRADCELLLTKNVGGDVEAASTAGQAAKDGTCSGKVLIRRVPPRAEDVIETRIAVVGNGEASPNPPSPPPCRR